MKKNLILLTGIVIIIAALAAGGCKLGNKSSEAPESPAGQKLVPVTEKHITLKDSVIDGKTHLFMYDKNSECGVIDDHLVVVKRNHTIKWKNAKESNINEIVQIRPVGDSTFFGAVPVVDGDVLDTTEIFKVNSGVFKLVIPDTAELDTIIKYEIHFTIHDKKDTIIIDPYLKIPDQQ